MRDDSNKAEASTAFKGNLILFSYHIKRREVLTFQPAPGLLHKHFKLCFSIIQLCIPLIHMCRLHQTPFPPLSSPVHLPALWKSQTQNSLAPVFTSRSDSGFRSWVCWGVTARKGSTLHCSHAMPTARNVQSVCWHMGSNAQRAVGSAGTHCWAGMAVPSTRVGPTLSSCCCSSQLLWSGLFCQSPLWEPALVPKTHWCVSQTGLWYREHRGEWRRIIKPLAAQGCCWNV